MLLQGSVLQFNFYKFCLGLWFPVSAEKCHEFHYLVVLNTSGTKNTLSQKCENRCVPQNV